MKVFESPDYSMEALTKFIEKQTRKEGIINKKSLETIERITVLYRPFRRIAWKLESSSGRKEAISYMV
ncbi:MAG: hypothetical protein ACFFFK_02240 [Candidatus Thorarchaeota archaeon]